MAESASAVLYFFIFSWLVYTVGVQSQKNQWRAFLALARPFQWVKNVFVLAPLVFSGAFLNPALVGRALFAFVIFCFASSAVYAFNDLADAPADRLHPRKAARPVASGAVASHSAAYAAGLLSVVSLVASFFLGFAVFVPILLYVLLNIAYSLWLRRIPIIDIVSVSLGFVLRVLTGIAAIGAPYSPWILSAAFFLALFLTTAKRRLELGLSHGAVARDSLARYATPLLDSLLAAFFAITLSVFAAYAFLEARNPWFPVTIIFVVLGMSRFLYSAKSKTAATDDHLALLRRDPLILFSVAAFVVFAFLFNA